MYRYLKMFPKRTMKWNEIHRIEYTNMLMDNQREDNKIALVRDVYGNIYGMATDHRTGKFHAPQYWAHTQCIDVFAKDYYITCKPIIAQLYGSLNTNCMICEEPIEKCCPPMRQNCDTVFNNKRNRDVDKLSRPEIEEWKPAKKLEINSPENDVICCTRYEDKILGYV